MNKLTYIPPEIKEISNIFNEIAYAGCSTGNTYVSGNCAVGAKAGTCTAGTYPGVDCCTNGSHPGGGASACCTTGTLAST